MRQTYTFLQFERIQLLRDREALILIVLQDNGDMVLDCYVTQGSFYVNFFSDQLRELEDPKTCALRLLEERSIAWRELQMLEPVMPIGGDVERFHVMVAHGCEVPDEHDFLIVDLSMLLKYMDMNVFVSPEGKKALMHFLR